MANFVKLATRVANFVKLAILYGSTTGNLSFQRRVLRYPLVARAYPNSVLIYSRGSPNTTQCEFCMVASLI